MTLKMLSSSYLLMARSTSVVPLLSFWKSIPRCFGWSFRAVWKYMVNRVRSIQCLLMIAWLIWQIFIGAGYQAIRIPFSKNSNLIFEFGWHERSKRFWSLMSYFKKKYLSWVPSMHRDKLRHKGLVMIITTRAHSFEECCPLDLQPIVHPSILLPPTSCLIPTFARTGIGLTAA